MRPTAASAEDGVPESTFRESVLDIERVRLIFLNDKHFETVVKRLKAAPTTESRGSELGFDFKRKINLLPVTPGSSLEERN